MDTEDPVVVVARASDPGTSHEAASVLTDQQEKIRKSVECVCALLAAAGEPLSDMQILERWPTVYHRAFSDNLPRMARLWAQRKGLVEQAGEGRHHNRRVRVWALVRKESAEE